MINVLDEPHFWALEKSHIRHLKCIMNTCTYIFCYMHVCQYFLNKLFLKTSIQWERHWIECKTH